MDPRSLICVPRPSKGRKLFSPPPKGTPADLPDMHRTSEDKAATRLLVSAGKSQKELPLSSSSGQCVTGFRKPWAAAERFPNSSSARKARERNKRLLQIERRGRSRLQHEGQRATAVSAKTALINKRHEPAAALLAETSRPVASWAPDRRSHAAGAPSKPATSKSKSIQPARICRNGGSALCSCTKALTLSIRVPSCLVAGRTAGTRAGDVPLSAPCLPPQGGVISYKVSCVSIRMTCVNVS